MKEKGSSIQSQVPFTNNDRRCTVKSLLLITIVEVHLRIGTPCSIHTYVLSESEFVKVRAEKLPPWNKKNCSRFWPIIHPNFPQFSGKITSTFRVAGSPKLPSSSQNLASAHAIAVLNYYLSCIRFKKAFVMSSRFWRVVFLTPLFYVHSRTSNSPARE